MTADDLHHWRYVLTCSTHDGRRVYAVREVHFSAHGDVRAWSLAPVEISGEHLSTMLLDLQRIDEAAMARWAYDIDTREWIETIEERR